jgi:hypothetical protein
MVDGHKIKKKVEIKDFLEYLRDYDKEDIETTVHTFFRFGQEQRKIYNESFIKEFIFHETPFLAGIQNNNLWAVFYKQNDNLFRIILDIQPNKIYIVTFYTIDSTQIPKI